MSLSEQKILFREGRKKFPQYFCNVNVIEVGSFDIKGNNRYLFRRSNYIGIDLHKGDNVDLVGPAHELIPVAAEQYKNMAQAKYHNRVSLTVYNIVDVIISTEYLGHDQNWMNTLVKMYNYLKPGGLLLISAAGVTNKMFSSILSPNGFECYCINPRYKEKSDFHFYGIKSFKPYNENE